MAASLKSKTKAIERRLETLRNNVKALKEDDRARWGVAGQLDHALFCLNGAYEHLQQASHLADKKEGLS